MGFSRFWLTMADKEIKVHRRVIRMIFTMIQRAKTTGQWRERYLYTTMTVRRTPGRVTAQIQFPIFKLRHEKTNKMSVRPAKTQISLGIRPVWSESSLCAQWVDKDSSFLHADSEDSDQTGRMPRLIWVFAGRTLILLVFSCCGLNIGSPRVADCCGNFLWALA